MIVHAVNQGSLEWLRLRMGRPTASNFNRLVTPGGKLSSQASDYCNQLLAELILGRPLEGPSMPWMDHGKKTEAEARSYYSLLHDKVTLTQVGFITTDDGLVGCSPDSLIDEDGMLEIKCPKESTHVGYLLSDHTAAKEYMPQLQGQLYVTGRAYVDILSYHPEMPEAIIRVERNEEFLKVLDAALKDFLAVLDVRRSKIEARGWIKKIAPVEKFDWLGISQADLDAMYPRSTQ